MAIPAERAGEVRTTCVPVADRYKYFRTIQPHLRGLFDGMYVPVDDDYCVGRDLCTGCIHRYPYGEDLVELLDLDSVVPSPEALSTLIVEPASAETYFNTLGELGISPQELRILVADPQFRRDVDEKLASLNRTSRIEQATRELDLRPLGVLQVVANIVWSTLDTDRLKNRSAITPILLASLDEQFIRQFIHERMNMHGDRVLYEFFFGDFDNRLNVGQRKEHVRNEIGVSPKAIDRTIQKFRHEMTDFIKSGQTPELADIKFDHRILGSVINSMVFYFISAPSGTKKAQGLSLIDWISDEAKAFELNPKPSFIEEIRYFKRALAKTTDTSKSVTINE
jgi:hypothetical protein